MEGNLNFDVFGLLFSFLLFILEMRRNINFEFKYSGLIWMGGFEENRRALTEG
jgi:hypothetical protein